jgi:L-aspartate oxidase
MTQIPIPRYLLDFDLESLPARHCDMVVVGSGVAGLSTALRVARRYRVCLLTKSSLTVNATTAAQGGIASALAPGDSPELHFRDTVETGRGLCEEEAVWILVREGPERLLELIEETGADFDREGDRLALTTEGGHSRARVAHARGDATGSELEAGLTRRLLYQKRLSVHEDYFVVDVLVDQGRCVGVLGMDVEKGTLSCFLSSAVVLATGGLGQLFLVTTNPWICTGDGVAVGLRAGAEVADLEFIQFHPTALHLPESPRWLISEAMRGEGAVIVDHRGRRIMKGVHPLEDLAPRDVVVAQMVRVMKEQDEDHLFLDTSGIPPERLKERFPNIYQHCLEAGIDITRMPIPVSPAAHYASGGLVTDVWGKTPVQGLYACGEVACTGVHGANRLASNSLLEGLVFGHRIAQDFGRRREAGELEPPRGVPISHRRKKRDLPVDLQLLRAHLQQLMMDDVGVRRSREGLEEARDFLEENWDLLDLQFLNPAGLELQNMFIVARVIVEAALAREESRGCHFRTDFPGEAEHWRRHIVFRRSEEGVRFCTRGVGELASPEYEW